MCLCVCFPSNTEVWTMTTGAHLMPSLSPYDEVMSLDFKSTSIRKTDFYTYLHHDPTATAEFLKITTTNNQVLRISEEHFLYTSEKLPILARNIKVGDKLLHVNPKLLQLEDLEVILIETEDQTGIFAPLTHSGNLIVNGFVVSCYAHVQSHKIGHRTTAPLRMWYKFNKKWYKKSKFEPKIGLHGFANFLLKITPNFLKKLTTNAKIE